MTTADGIGEAGQRGARVRSDLFVRFEAGRGSGLDLEVSSKVAACYGQAIREQARSLLEQLGQQGGRLVIEDQGALPFTIAARIEAAVARAMGSACKQAVPPHLPARAASVRNRLRRSRLYLPGAQPRYFINAALFQPDAIILDLEDSVHAREKDSARMLVRNALAAVDFGACERMVRINQLPLGLADLDAIIPQLPDLILIPKVQDAADVTQVDQRVRELLTRAGHERSIWLMPILETALGLEQAFSIATASENVAALTLGLEDLTADLGVVKTKEGAESLYARQRLVNAARAAGIQAIDSVFGDVDDLDGLKTWGRRARGLGFCGMGCVHPRQIPCVHEAFAPGADEIRKAARIVAAFAEAQAKGLGVVSLGSRMIDPPVVERALALMEQARALGLLPDAAPGEEPA